MSRDLVSGVFWLAVALFAAGQGWALKLGTLNRPGPGFFPFWGGVVLAVLSLVLLFSSARERWALSLSGVQWRKLLAVAGALLAYLLLLETLGFLIVTLLFLLLLFRLEGRGWVFSGVCAVAGAAGAYALFQLWLKTQLPRGPFGF